MQAMASARAILLLFPTTAASPPSACPPSTLAATNRARHRTLLMRCRAAAGDYRVDRRDVLAGLTGVAAGGLGAGAYPNLALAAAGTVSDAADTCVIGDKVTAGLLTCTPGAGSPCPAPSSAATVDFAPHTGAPTRVRRPAHLADASLVEKYKLALARMKALPDSDPRSFASQAAIHQAYCDGHYRLAAGAAGSAAAPGGAPFDVHFSWVFAPWHRMYIYFYERILGALINDPDFALPYWNWDAPAGMALPEMFKDPGSPLHDANRNPDHVDAYLVLDFLKKAGDPVRFDLQAVRAREFNDVVKDNLATVHNQMIRQGRGTRCFLGEKFCTRYKENQGSGTAGTLESKAHTGVHIWLGDPAKSVTGHDGKEHSNADMGFLGTAARDPVFYSHHANVDRMWHLWNTTLGGRNFADAEWLDTSFAFYDETPRLVRVRVRDVLDAAKLGYTYAADEPLLWLGHRPTVRRAPAAGAATRRRVMPATAPVVFPVTLREGEVVVVPGVARPRNKRKGELEAVVFDGVEFDPAAAAKFDVAINVPPELAAGVGPRCVEYAGSFASLPRGGGGGESGGTVVVPLELPVEDVLADIGVGDGTDNAVDVVIVPRTSGVTITSKPRIESKDCDPASA